VNIEHVHPIAETETGAAVITIDGKAEKVKVVLDRRCFSF
jgi:hypothetical protein